VVSSSSWSAYGLIQGRRTYPGIWTKNAHTHGTLVIIADIWVVDLGLEVQGRGLERIVGWEGNVNLEIAALEMLDETLPEGEKLTA
jgi:hypothetical protein